MAFSLFISDLHLSPQQPTILDQLRRFLAGPAKGAERLFILGDLFDAWIGDDAITPPISGVVADLKRLSDSGTWIGLMHGNRDFLIGEDFCHQAGCALLDDPTVTNLYGIPTLLMHGDLLCTGDTAYQRFRDQVRDPAFIADFLAKPIPERLALAAEYRRMSGEATSTKPEAIMDVNEGTVQAYLCRHGVRRMIHGHTHRPNHHPMVIEGEPADRWVLPEWNASQYGFVRADKDGLSLQIF